LFINFLNFYFSEPLQQWQLPWRSPWNCLRLTTMVARQAVATDPSKAAIEAMNALKNLAATGRGANFLWLFSIENLRLG